MKDLDHNNRIHDFTEIKIRKINLMKKDVMILNYAFLYLLLMKTLLLANYKFTQVGIVMDCSLPGSSVHGIFQVRVLEWGAIAFSELNYWYLPTPKYKSDSFIHTFLNLGL